MDPRAARAGDLRHTNTSPSSKPAPRCRKGPEDAARYRFCPTPNALRETTSPNNGTRGSCQIGANHWLRPPCGRYSASVARAPQTPQDTLKPRCCHREPLRPARCRDGPEMALTEWIDHERKTSSRSAIQIKGSHESIAGASWFPVEPRVLWIR